MGEVLTESSMHLERMKKIWREVEGTGGHKEANGGETLPQRGMKTDPQRGVREGK